MLDGFAQYGRSASPPRRQRACHNCSKAKARCNFQDENIGKHCDRCHRLMTECLPQTTKSLRRPRQLKLTPRHDTRVINVGQQSRSNSPPELAPQWMGHTPPLALLATPVSGAPLSLSPTPDFHYNPLASLYYPLPNTLLALPSPPTQDIFTDRGSPNGYPAPPTPPHAPSPSHRKSRLPGHGLTWDQAEQALAEFQTLHVPHFPFVVVPDGMSARQLCSGKPFLFRAILLVAAGVPAARRAAMKKGVLAYLGHHLLVPEDRYLDLLQGLLVLIAWGDFDFYRDRQFAHLVALVKSYAYNLGQAQTVAIKALWLVDPQIGQEYRLGHGLDEQRAYLGCYYAISATSALFNRTYDFQKPGTKPDQCVLGDLDESTIVALNPNILHTVRIQAVIDRIITASSTIPGDGETSSAAAALAYLASGEVQSCRSRLGEIAEGLDRTDPQFAFHWMHYNAALVRLYGPAVVASSSSSYLLEPTLNSASIAHFLSAALSAASSFFAAFLSVPPEQLLRFPFPAWSQLVSVVSIASHLLLVPSSGNGGWDAASARQTLDLVGVLGAVMGGLAGASVLRSQQGEGEVTGRTDGEKCRFLKFADRIGRIRDWYEMRLASEDVGSIILPVSGGQQSLAQMGYDDEILDSPHSQIWAPSIGDEGWGTVC